MLGSKSDEQLISKALQGSERAWLSLVKRYEKRLYNYAYRMAGNADDARDMLQDILMAVYRNLGAYRGEGVFAAWLFRLASFRCTDFLRRRRPQVYNSDEMDLMTDERLDRQPEANMIGTQQNREVIRLMNNLSREQRLVVELKFFQHFTFDEIGAQLGISSNTAKTRLYAALKKMRNITEVSLAV
jgi:RNA polymerase sigma-70 factor (ECF subfamily)